MTSLPPLLVVVMMVVVIYTTHSSCGVSVTTQPGMRTAITSEGLDYLNGIWVSILKDQLDTLKIPDISKKFWEIKDIIISGFDVGSSTITSDPAVGLLLKADNVSLTATANINYSSFFLSGKGAITVTGKGVSLVLGALVQRGLQGEPRIVNTRCSLEGKDIKVHYSGSGSGTKLFPDPDIYLTVILKTILNKTACDQVQKLLDKLDKTISSYSTINIDDFVNFDISLMSQPIFTSSYFTMDHKGDFVSASQANRRYPSLPSLLPLVGSSMHKKHMVHFYVTDYVINTAAMTYMRAGALQFLVSADSLDQDMPFLQLNTQTFSLIVPQLYHRFPNQSLMLNIRALKDPPSIQFTNKGANVTVTGAVDVYANGTTDLPLAFSLKFKASALADVSLVNNTEKNGTFSFTASATSLKLHFHQLSSNIGEIDVDKINMLGEGLRLIQTLILPRINKLAGKGFPVPQLGSGLTFANPLLRLDEGYMVVETDVEYNNPQD